MSQPNSEPPQTPDNDTVIKSLWLKETTWERLGVVKNSFHLTWSEFFELLLHHLHQSGYIPKEAQKLLNDIPGESLEHTSFQKNVLQLGPPPWEVSRLLNQLEEEVELLNLNLEQLVATVEDHAESLLALPSEPPPLE